MNKEECESVTLDGTRVTSCSRDAVLRTTHVGKEREKTHVKQQQGKARATKAHLNPNSILQTTIFIHLCETYLTVLSNFSLFKHYFFLKYQTSAAKRQVIGGVSIQTHPCRDFLSIPLKTSLKGWHKQWFL
jgi:hypothetical protein